MAGLSELEELRRKELDRAEKDPRAGRRTAQQNRKLTTKEIKQMDPEAYKRYLDAQLGGPVFGRLF